MQDDCLDVTNKPFYKRRKQLIPPPRGASFRTSKIMLMLTWRLFYGGAVITSIPPPRGASFRTSKIMLMLTWRLFYGGAVITSITVRTYVRQELAGDEL